jgi:hypothetical protein
MQRSGRCAPLPLPTIDRICARPVFILPNPVPCFFLKLAPRAAFGFVRYLSGTHLPQPENCLACPTSKACRTTVRNGRFSLGQ